MWWALAAAAVPYVVSAMQGKEKRPGAPVRAQLANRDGQVSQMLDTAFNPNSKQYSMASDVTADQVNRILARQGFAGSGIGAQLHGNTQAQLAEQWLRDAAQRQGQALQIANGYDMNQANFEQGQNNAQYQHAMGAYQEANRRNAQQVQGISNMINMGMQGYNQDRMMTSYENMIAQGMNPRTAPQVGTPFYGSAPAPAPAPVYGAMPAEYGYGQAPMPGYRTGGGGY